jgi:hypothetical protein
LPGTIVIEYDLEKKEYSIQKPKEKVGTKK